MDADVLLQIKTDIGAAIDRVVSTIEHGVEKPVDYEEASFLESFEEVTVKDKSSDVVIDYEVEEVRTFVSVPACLLEGLVFTMYGHPFIRWIDRKDAEAWIKKTLEDNPVKDSYAVQQRVMDEIIRKAEIRGRDKEARG